MPKTNLNDILKSGEKFKIRSLSDATEEDKKRFEECRKRQDECLARKKVHLDIWRFRITI